MPPIGHVRFYDAKVNALLRGRTGPVARDLDRRAQKVEDQAKRNASVADGVPPMPRSFAPGLRTVTGRGRNSISHTLGEDGRGLYARIGTNVNYMAIQELKHRYTWLVPALKAAKD